jgi:hypothetical protein
MADPQVSARALAPSLEVLEALADAPVQAAAESPTAIMPCAGTLGIGSLRSR